ncbi:helix-turn-helix transcriptional regulator [Bacillus cereus]|uniref:helix-turn-helix transcriptional regulator n=1 Tax=Bacillus cereus TaxID=1396 RepID=UPI0024076161|nr:helix-turn-helix transcriptional regulator [Bacillus cereus]EKS7872325.1 helix-turn-helix transcriptional regulator [Bacillus cereus]MDF9472137.1 helix-turn-helix transcriptional regulator [Bacillus cereus]
MERRSDTMYQITKEKLRLIRTLTGVSQREFAHLIGTTNRSVSAWEVGRSTPNVDSVKKIVDFVGEEEFRLLDSVVYALPLQDLSLKLREKAASK